MCISLEFIYIYELSHFNKLLLFQNADHKSKPFLRKKIWTSVGIAHRKTVNRLVYEWINSSMINIRSCKDIYFDTGHNVMTAKLNGINFLSESKHSTYLYIKWPSNATQYWVLFDGHVVNTYTTGCPLSKQHVLCTYIKHSLVEESD